MKLFVVRHAKAGDREKWTEPDHLRPLTKPGREQAVALVAQLADFVIDRVISSPYVRCVETVEPLAAGRGVEVEEHDALAEGAFLEDTSKLIGSLDGPAALCTHGDVLGWLIADLRSRGIPGADPSLGKKGSTWVLDLVDGEVTAGTYLEPPA